MSVQAQGAKALSRFFWAPGIDLLKEKAMALFEVDTLDPHEGDQIHQYAEFVNCLSTGRYLITIRSIHRQSHCPHHPLTQPGRMEEPGRLLKCRIMPNGVHAHLYINEHNEQYLRFIEVSDADNETIFDAYY